MRSILASLAVLAALLPISALAQAWEEIPGTRQKFGQWDLVAWREGGRSGCSMLVGYTNGAHMNFQLEGDQFRIRWWHPSWRYTDGQTIPIAFWVDGSPPHTVDAKRVGDSKWPWLLAVLHDSPELFDQLRTGAQLHVRAQGGTSHAFVLTATNAALTALRNCAARHRGTEPQPTAAATPRDGQAARALPALTADQRVNAVRLAANLLTRMPGFRILNEEEQRALNSTLARLDAAVVWRSEGGVYGAIHLFANQAEATIPKLASALTGAMGEQCKGEFTLTMAPDVRSAAVRRIHVACSDGASQGVSRIILMPWAKEGVYFFVTEGTVENNAAVVRAEELLRNALFEITQR